MIHKICPICGNKISEILPGKDDRNINHKVYVCDADINHKFWVSEYESDCLRWNPGATFEDDLYFRKFKNSQRDIVKELATKEIQESIKAQAYTLLETDFSDAALNLAIRQIEKEYEATVEYSEIFDKKVHENLLSIIESQNSTIAGLIEEYRKLEKYSDELQAKLDKKS